MKQGRVLAILTGCAGLLAAEPRWVPLPPAGTWQAFWSWLLADPQRALTLLVGATAWLLAAWLFVVTVLMVLATSARGCGRAARRTAEALTPSVARGLLKAFLGAAVAVSTAGPAIAAPTPVPVVSSGSVPGLAPVPEPVVAAPQLPALLDLDRPHQSPTPPARPTPPAVQQKSPAAAVPQAGPPAAYRVQSGDTLWGLAVEHLPTASSPARITRVWQQWYAANQQEIGPDPNLLLVGEALVIAQEAP